MAEGADSAPSKLTREEFFKGRDTPTDEYVIEIWRCNWRTVQVYRTCQLSFVGMSGSCVGLSSLEIRAALQLERVPRPRQRAMARELQFMGRCAAEYLNEEARKASNKAG